jgi:hypothetical protein
MNQTEAMVMEKKGPGLMSTLTNAAVRAKSSSMPNRLPRMRTDSGMLLGRRQMASDKPRLGRGYSHRQGSGAGAKGGRAGEGWRSSWAQMMLWRQ